jgi:hypothetical protein
VPGRGRVATDLATLIAYLLILWAVIALGFAVAWWLGRRRGKPERGEWSEALTFVGFSFGFLLALLQIFVVNHYRDARVQADTEATTLVRFYDDLGPFPQRVRTSAQHDLVCYMRSIIEKDWKRQEDGKLTQAPEAVITGDRVRALRGTLPTGSFREQTAYSRVAQDVSDAGTARQQLLNLSDSEVPTVLWVLVFFSACTVAFLMFSEFRSRPRIARVAVLVAMILLLTFETGSLVTLDRPFGPVVRIQPQSLTRTLALLEAGRARNPIFRECPTPAALRNG